MYTDTFCGNHFNLLKTETRFHFICFAPAASPPPSTWCSLCLCLKAYRVGKQFTGKVLSWCLGLVCIPQSLRRLLGKLEGERWRSVWLRGRGGVLQMHNNAPRYPPGHLCVSFQCNSVYGIDWTPDILKPYTHNSNSTFSHGIFFFLSVYPGKTWKDKTLH